MRLLRWAHAAFAIGAFGGLALDAPALANDTTAELTSGGLVLEQSADIEMRSEDLAISEREISVRYRFFNHGAADETVTVAFPMPDVVWQGVDTNIAVPDPESPNFLDFHTFADGREVEAQYEQKAFADGRGNFRLAQIPGRAARAAERRDMEGAGCARPRRSGQADQAEDRRAGRLRRRQGLGTSCRAQLDVQVVVLLAPDFPAGREITVEHRYTPSVGATTGTRLQMDPIEPADLSEYESRYCVDKRVPGRSSRRAGQAADLRHVGAPLFEKRIAYVLTTGANWAGPIGDFHLTVDKGSPDSLVSFCADGVKKIGPTLFEVRHANFTPARDLEYPDPLPPRQVEPRSRPDRMTFKAIRVDKTDAGQSVRFVEMDESELMDGDVTVRVTHSTVNYKDGLALSGKSAIPRRFPLVLGIDFAGIVETSSHPGFAAGDEVLLERLRPRRDAFRRLCRTRAGEGRLAGETCRRAGPAPRRWRSAPPATRPRSACTRSKRPGVTPAMGPAIVTGAAGGVGSVAIALLAKAGWSVIASTGRASRGGLSRRPRRERSDRSRDAFRARQAAGQGALGGGRRQRRLAHARQCAGADPLRRRDRGLRPRGRHGPARLGRAVHPARRAAARHRQRAIVRWVRASRPGSGSRAISTGRCSRA